MLTGIQNISETELLQWIRANQKTGANILSSGYQGYVYLYEDGTQRLIIKTPMGWGLGWLIRLWMLRNEYRAYSRLSGIQGVARCYGLLDGRYLVLEHIDGIPIRNAQITHRDFFFETLLKVIKALHHAGVAHTDLKKKDNLLVVEGKKPYVIDFGVAVVKKTGFAPLNRYLYHMASTFDFNAWVKLKYDGDYAALTPEDKEYFNRTVIEKVSRWIKDHYLILKKALLR
jgi:predicted Ser/Thr protein kinase